MQNHFRRFLNLDNVGSGEMDVSIAVDEERGSSKLGRLGEFPDV